MVPWGGPASPVDDAPIGDAAVGDGQPQRMRRRSVDQLASKARAAKAAARGDGRQAIERVRRRRGITHGRGDDGSAWLRASGTPDDIARILGGIVPWAEHARRAARAAGEVLTSDQASFDGLVALAAHPVPRTANGAGTGTGRTDDDRSVGSGSGDDLIGWADDTDDPTTERDDIDGGKRSPGAHPKGLTAGPGSPRWAAKVIVNIDLAALRRGFTLPGERCEITGIGPVPVATVDDVLARDDSFLAAVVREGTDIAKVAHLGRAPTAAQRTALESDHTTCCIDGCPDPPMVIDHHHRYTDDGPRTLANLGPLCDDHDHRKTHQRWILVRHGRSRRLLPPHHPDTRGATPGGSIDLDAPLADEEAGAPSRRDRAGSGGGSAAATRAGGSTPGGDSHQLDLLAG